MSEENRGIQDGNQVETAGDEARLAYETPLVKSGPIFERTVLGSDCTPQAPACVIPPVCPPG